MGYSRKYPHTPMEDIGNPVRNAQWVWLEIHKFPQNFVNFARNSRKTIHIFAKFWNSSRFWISRLGILQKLQLSFLEILKFLGTQFCVVHKGCVDIFWNSPIWLSFCCNLQFVKRINVDTKYEAVIFPFRNAYDNWKQNIISSCVMKTSIFCVINLFWKEVKTGFGYFWHFQSVPISTRNLQW